MSHMLTKFKDQSAGTGFNKNGTKAKQVKWDSVPPPDYTLQNIPKDMLWIDHEYQRNEISLKNVNRIASMWSWHCVGAITVGRRVDGTLVVIEGQHRVLAAMKRVEIKELPCLVFNVNSLEEEAAIFLAVNTIRKTVSALDQHRAGHVANDPLRTKVQAMLDDLGISIIKNPRGSTQTAAIGNILHQYKVQGEDALYGALTIAKAIEFPNGIPGNIIRGLAVVAKRNPGKIGFIAERCAIYPAGTFEASMRRRKELLGKGGELVEATSICEVINKGLRSNKISVDIRQ